MIVPKSLVEKPHVYILGRCGSSEVEQLAYINTRKACLHSLSTALTASNGVSITDIMRFFHGDGPQQEFEAGEQKGGNAGCASCSGDARKYKLGPGSFSKQTTHKPVRATKEGAAGTRWTEQKKWWLETL